MSIYADAEALAAMTASGKPQGSEPGSLERHFGTTASHVLPLWIAEPYVPLSPHVIDAVKSRATDGWFGYEVRPDEALESFWRWTERRHGWNGENLHCLVSPSVGTSLGALIEILSQPGESVILQPPVFTDFKPLIRRAGREPMTNPLRLTDGRYTMDLEDLAAKAANPTTTVMILCNPHNPVGRSWTPDELRQVATICGEHGVAVIADEIHADLALPPNRFAPFAVAASGSGVRWAATHGAIKTFGLAGLADTFLVTADEEIANRFKELSSRLHLTRNNVIALAAMEAAYKEGDSWLDDLLSLISGNIQSLRNGLPDEVGLVTPESTYLAWLDFRNLEIPVPELATWLAKEAGIALSPGHWFGREGAGFARMTIAVPEATIEEACSRIRQAVAAS